MYDMTKFKTRYFNMKLKNGKIIDIEPPKMKILKKITNLSAVKENKDISENEMMNLIEAVVLALNKNKQNYKVSVKQIEEDYNFLEIADFLNNYFEWINKIQNIKN